MVRVAVLEDKDEKALLEHFAEAPTLLKAKMAERLNAEDEWVQEVIGVTLYENRDNEAVDQELLSAYILDEANEAVAKHFFERFDLEDVTLTEAMQRVCQVIIVPEDPENLRRMMDNFITSYAKQNDVKQQEVEDNLKKIAPCLIQYSLLTQQGLPEDEVKQAIKKAGVDPKVLDSHVQDLAANPLELTLTEKKPGVTITGIDVKNDCQYLKMKVQFKMRNDELDLSAVFFSEEDQEKFNGYKISKTKADFIDRLMGYGSTYQIKDNAGNSVATIRHQKPNWFSKLFKRGGEEALYIRPVNECRNDAEPDEQARLLANIKDSFGVETFYADDTLGVSVVSMKNAFDDVSEYSNSSSCDV